jgi:hypothetical protein
MALHWSIWLIVGGVLAVWSVKLGDKFLLFFYVGLIFAAIGLGKMLIGFMLREKYHEAVVHAHSPQVVHSQHPAVKHGPVHPAHTQHPAVPGLNQTHFSCPRCKYPMAPAARFCSMCGLRVR